jgi:nucleotidyltransferase AbiEii toxin of type IV toxin-antitoxin system
MAPPRTYSTAGAFRKALEERLKNASQTDQIDLNRLRRHVSFDRLLARLFRIESPPWVLKGGYALELRFKAARSTIDIDLALQRIPAVAGGDSATGIVQEMLQRAANIALGDWFEYKIGPPILDLDAAPYGGARYSIEARMDARIFARFHLDAGIGDAVMQPLEVLECRDWLGFAGIEKCQVLVIAREQQFAEKLHAYTLPRSNPNSRVKDLVDLALLSGSGDLNRQRLLDALRLTFERRATHLMPAELAAPPSEWQLPFQALAEECGLPTDIATVFERVREFLEKVLAREGGVTQYE